MTTRYQYESIAIVLAKILMYFQYRENWLQFSYVRTDYNGLTAHCILGAIGKFAIGKDISDTNKFLSNALIEYVQNKKLTINTGKYDLNLATFNDNVPYELLMAFLKNTYDNLMYDLDHDKK